MHLTGTLLTIGAVLIAQQGQAVRQPGTGRSEYQGSPELAEAASDVITESFSKIVDNLLGVIKRFDNLTQLVHPEKEAALTNAKSKVNDIADAGLDHITANFNNVECKLQGVEKILTQKTEAFEQLEGCMDKGVKEFHETAEAFYAYADQVQTVIVESRKEVEECEKQDVYLIPQCVGQVVASFISRSAVYVVTLPIYLLRGEKLFVNTKLVLTQCGEETAAIFEEVVRKIKERPCDICWK